MERKGIIAEIVCVAAALTVLYWISTENYVLFHSLIELCCILIAWTIYVIGLNARQFPDTDFFQFLGIAFLFFGIMNVLHLFSFTGIGIFSSAGSDLYTQSGLLSRYLEATALLLAPLFLRRKINLYTVTGIYALVTILMYGAVYVWGFMPRTFVPGTGVTAFKNINEFIVIVLFSGALFHVRKKKTFLPAQTLGLLTAGLVLAICVEIPLLNYDREFGVMYSLSHFIKLLSFYLFYRAILNVGLLKPFEMVFLDLTNSAKALQGQLEDSKDRFEIIFNHAIDGIALADAETRKIYLCNKAMCDLTGRSQYELRGMAIRHLHPENEYDIQESQFDSLVMGQKKIVTDVPLKKRDGAIVYVDISAALIQFGKKEYLLGIFHDITERRKIEQDRCRIV